MIKFFYRTQAGSFVEFTDRVNLSEQNVVLTTEAEEGKVGSTTIIVDDPDGDWDIGGHRHVFVEEDEATWIRVWAGYTAEREIIRGPYRTGVARQWKVTLVDLNSVLARRIFTEEDANRPAETDVARLTWLLGTPEASLIDDDTYFSTASPVMMSVANYIGQRLIDVIDDCAQQSGKNWYLLVVFDSPDFLFSFWYDFSESTEFASSLRISNVIADVDNIDTWYASLDTTLTRSPWRVYSGGYGNYDGGAVYRERAATETAFALGGRDTVLSWPNVKTQAAAQARTDRELLVISTEEDIIKTSIEVSPEHVNDVIAGQRLEAKFSHLGPLYDAFTSFRVLTLTTTFVTPGRYKQDLTLSPIAEAPVISCATVVSGIQTYDSGQLGSLSPSLSGPPIAYTADTPSVFPSVMVTGLFTHCGVDTMGTDPIVSGITTLQKWPNYAGNPRTSTMAFAGYEAIAAGSPGSTSLSWTVGNGGTERYRALAVYIPTAATAPVQSGSQVLSGATIVLGAAPTPGNLFVLVRMVVTSPFSDIPTGFTQVEEGSFVTSSPGTFTIDICVRCVQPGDTATVGLADTSFAHWQYLSEWAIT